MTHEALIMKERTAWFLLTSFVVLMAVLGYLILKVVGVVGRAERGRPMQANRSERLVADLLHRKGLGRRAIL